MENIMEDRDLRVREELLSIHALNPFIANASSPRALMFSGHLSQMVVLDDPEPPIIQTGLERQLAKNTFSKKTLSDVRVIGILKRYSGIAANSVSGVAETVVIVQDVETHELDAISIPVCHKLQQYFGFKYKVNDIIKRPDIIDTFLPKDTVLADSPSVSEEGDYRFGRPVNIAYLHIPEVTGDGVVISKDCAEKFSFRTYETVVVEFGEKAFPLNLYGDDDNYKAFPDIGEYINKDRVVLATRKYEGDLSPALVSRTDVKDYSVYFDKPYYSKTPGGRVADIKVYHNDKARKSTYTKTTGQVSRYAEALKRYYADILTLYTAKEREYRTRTGRDLPVTERMHRLLIDAYAHTESSRNVRYTHKNDLVDLYRVEILIEHHVTPSIGFKMTTMSGNFYKL